MTRQAYYLNSTDYQQVAGKCTNYQMQYGFR